MDWGLGAGKFRSLPPTSTMGKPVPHVGQGGRRAQALSLGLRRLFGRMRESKFTTTKTIIVFQCRFPLMIIYMDVDH